MRENRTCGSEGGEAKSLPYPYRKDDDPSAPPPPCNPLKDSVLLWP
jgi:hypothetical protein